MSKTEKSHYDDKYFDWQCSLGEFGGWANLPKFQPFIREDDQVIDFGCGGAFLLKNLRCAKKIGIEINPAGRENARNLGIQAVPDASHVEDGWADVIISNNALEHTTDPLRELEALYPKLKPGGRIVFMVPCESVRYAYKAKDVNQHLYSWSPMCIGNLFTKAGFAVEEAQPYYHKWPKHYRAIARIGGRFLFNLCSRIYAHWERSWFQVRVIAHRTAQEQQKAA